MAAVPPWHARVRALVLRRARSEGGRGRVAPLQKLTPAQRGARLGEHAAPHADAVVRARRRAPVGATRPRPPSDCARRNTTRATRACKAAPQHIAHGSTLALERGRVNR